MQVDNSTPTKEITIKGLTFVVPAPFAEGHVLKANEADVLNQTLGENLRNNFAGTVAKAVEAAGSVEAVDKAALQKELNAYVVSYEFGIRRTGSSKPKVEPRVKIALRLATEKVKAAIRAKGKKVTEFSAEKIAAFAEALLEKDPSFYAEADRQLKASQKVAADAIDLSDLGA